MSPITKTEMKEFYTYDTTYYNSIILYKNKTELFELYTSQDFKYICKLLNDKENEIIKLKHKLSNKEKNNGRN